MKELIDLQTDYPGHEVRLKEQLLEAVASKTPEHIKYYPLYLYEIQRISDGQTTSDFLEILPLRKLGKVARAFLNVIDYYNIKNDPKKTTFNEASELQHTRQKNIFSFLNGLDLLLSTTDITLAQQFISTNKKKLGLASSFDSFTSMISYLDTIFPPNVHFLDRSKPLIQYPGTFSPFPHLGHLEVLNSAINTLGCEATVYTISNNTFRPQTNSSFNTRLDMLYRGFFDLPEAHVIGLGGDSSRQAEQMQLIAKTSGTNRIIYLCGSDALITKVQGVQEGKDQYSQSIFDKKPLFVLSRRKGEDEGKYQESCDFAESLGCSIISLPPPELALSGTLIRRSEPNQIMTLAPNDLTRSKLIEVFGMTG